MIEGLFLSKELSLLMKEKGFYEPCIAYYDDFDTNGDKDFHFVSEEYDGGLTTQDMTSEDYTIRAPLYQQATDWLLTKHGIDVYIKPEYSANELIDQTGVINFTINEWNTPDIIVEQGEWMSRRELLEKILERALKLI